MRIVLAGAGALALEIEQYVIDCRRADRGLRDADGCEVRAADVVFDGLFSPDGGRFGDFQTRPMETYGTLERCPPDAHFLIAIGDAEIRRRVWNELVAKGARFATLVHPSAVIAATARIGTGTVMCPMSFAAPLACIGRNVIVNTCASVAHDVHVGDHTFMSPYTCFGGNAAVGEACYVGTGAIVTPGHKVGAFSKVSAGAVVTSDVAPGSLAHGNPAKSRRMYIMPSETSDR